MATECPNCHGFVVEDLRRHPHALKARKAQVRGTLSRRVALKTIKGDSYCRPCGAVVFGMHRRQPARSRDPVEALEWLEREYPTRSWTAADAKLLIAVTKRAEVDTERRRREDPHTTRTLRDLPEQQAWAERAYVVVQAKDPDQLPPSPPAKPASPHSYKEIDREARTRSQFPVLDHDYDRSER